MHQGHDGGSRAASAGGAASGPEATVDRRVLALIAVLLAVLWFGALELRGLFWPDEGRYAEIAREMLVSGDFVTPRLNDLKYFEKPPLQYWASAVAFRIFGPDEWSARLWPATTGFLLLVLSGLMWWRWRGPEAGMVATLVQAGGWGILLGGQILTLDMGLTFCLAAALLALIAGERPRVSAAGRQRAMMAMWTALGFAVLSKGLVGVVLPALVLGAYALVERDVAVLRRAFSWRGIALFLLIVLPWFVAVQVRNPEFFDFFFVGEHLRRFSQPGHGRPGSWWYFLPIVVAGSLPWIGALPAVVRDAWRAPREGAFHVERMLVIWVVVTVVFFSLSRSKLPAYVLPALPALAWLLAIAPRAHHRRAAWHATIASTVAGVALVVLAFTLDRFARLRELGVDLQAYRPWLIAAGATMIVGAACAWGLRHRQPPWARVATLAIANLAAVQVALAGTHVLDAYYSAERTVESIVGEDALFPAAPAFYSVEMLDQSIPFYLGRPLTMVAYRGELAQGIASEPWKFVERREDFERLWRTAREAYAVMSPATHAELVAHDLPMTVMAADPRRVFVARGRWPPPLGAP